MCQLTYINIPNKNALIQSTLILSLCNTEKAHKDGFGFAQENRAIKTGKCPRESNFLDLKKVIKNTKPVILHVRQASVAHRNLIGDEFSHPFINEGILLAHNGTLTPKVGEIPKDVIDTQFFFQKFIDADGNIQDKLIKTMNKFWGKFAFIIRDNEDDYIVRGRSANLFKSDVLSGEEKIGFIINTEYQTLNQAIGILEKLLVLQIPDIKFTQPVIIEEQSIFKVNGIELDKIGTIVENYAPVVQRPTQLPFNQTTKPIIIGNSKAIEDDVLIANSISEFMNKSKLTFSQMDTMFYLIFGDSLISSDTETLLKFVKVLNSMQVAKGRLRAWQRKERMNLWKVYKFIQFPYMLNTPSEIKRGILRAKNEERKQ